MSSSSPSDSAAAVTTPTTGVGESKTTTQKTKNIKTIYLIRHAESEENRRLASLTRCFKRLKKFSLPSTDEVYSSLQLINIPNQIDSNVSEIGQQQITFMEKTLKEANFISKENITLIVHSPLLRAKQTCHGMLLGYSSAAGSTSTSTSTATTSTENGSTTTTSTSVSSSSSSSSPNVVELDLLLEKTPQEWTPLYYSTFMKRIDEFETWISNQDSHENIVIVGHSQFFKAMLHLDFKFNNCDVWKFNYNNDMKNQKDGTGTTTTKVEEEETTTTTTTTPVVDVNPDATTTTTVETTTTTWKLPPQWSNMTLLHKCDVESSKKDID